MGPDPFVRLAEGWRELNRPFEANENCGPSRGARWAIKDRKSPLLLTAVHGVRHQREGVVGLKANDANTAGLVLALAHHLKCSTGVIVRSGDGDDANSVIEHPFKSALAADLKLQRVRIMVDVHGMADHPDVDVAVGYGSTPTASTVTAGERLAQRLRTAGVRVDLGGEVTGLRGEHPGTMTNWGHRNGLVAVQLEIARSKRTFQSSATERARFLRAVCEALTDVTAER